ncbi:MAG: hypothetical protein Q7V10_06085, partial [Methanobacteriaceae archaeon]|nr:hypothetical protein [Methanobacteriaceae archaeon]MDO9626619.1 hypothetical protein [Methanobacteriaceae archaeon]
MNKTKIIVLSMLLMGLALFVNMDDVSADSSVIYVNATGGNDAWDGLSSSWNGTSGPKKTIGGGTNTVTANGTVNIANGLYTGSNNRDITLSKNMVIKGQSTDGTIINGSNDDRIFIINTGVNISLINITIANGRVKNNNGGAIRNNGGTLTVNNCNFKSNSANRNSGSNGLGGAIYNTGSLTIINSVFMDNTATCDGSAIWSSGSLTINNSNFTSNKATRDGGAIFSTSNTTISGSNFVNNSAVTNGGALTNSGNLTIVASNFSGNSASDGGAIYNTGSLTVTSTTFRENSAQNRGGAIYNNGNLSVLSSTFENNRVPITNGYDYNGGAIFNNFNANLNVTGSVFNYNTASVGGAILSFNNSTITGSTFTGNTAYSEYGGGAVAWGNTDTLATGTMNISDSTFTNNKAGYGGSIWSYGTLNVLRSTFTGNNATYNGGAIRTWGTLTISGSDLIGNNAGTRGTGISNYQGTTVANFNRIIGTGNIIESISGSIDAKNNWWGSNTSPSAKVSGSVDVSTWLVLNIISSPNSIYTGNTSTITADLTRNQNGVYFNPANGHVPDGIVVNFAGTLGSITSGTLVNGSVSRIFTAGYTPGVAVVNATVDTVIKNTTVNINPVASITINQSVNTPVNVGNKVTFLVNVKNNGPNTATNINIRDIIPSGLSGVIVTPSVGTYNAITGIWTIPSLTNGSTATLNITGNATAAMAGKTTENTATQISQTEYTPELAHSTIGVYTKMADVVMSQTSTKIVNVGDVVTYIVSIINIGPDAATNFIIEDIIPTGLLNVVVTPSTGTYSNGNWTVPFLANGDSATLTITAVASAAMAGKNTTNTATKIFETEYDPTTIGESVSADAYTKEAGLVVTNTANGDRLNVGQTGTFTVVVTNNGPDEATNIKITNDALPDAFIASFDKGNYADNIWTISSLASGESATMTFTCDALYDSYAGTTITNHITVDLKEYPFTVNVDDSSIYVKMANVVITQTGSYNKNNVTFIVTLRNNGPDNATNIRIENLIPQGLTNVVFTPSIGTYDSQTGIWTIPLLNNGQVATLNVTGTAVPQSTIYNVVSIISQDEYSQDSKNSIGGTYIPAADVRVSLYTSTGKYTNWDVNNVVTWVAEIINLGPDDAHDVVVTVLL